MPLTAIDTAEQTMTRAIEGRLPKYALTSLLTPAARKTFLEVCAVIERRYTAACGASKDPCLESGCSCEGEVCLDPLLRARGEYLIACGAGWAALFADPANRDASWKMTMAQEP